MKKQLSRALLSFVAVLVLAASAFAQTAGTVHIQVPFDFVVGQKQMPAGRYTVRRVHFSSESTLIIQGENKRDAAVVLTNTGDAKPAKAWLGFRQYGDSYFLTEVSMPGTASVRELPKTGGERRAERHLIEQATTRGGSKKVTIIGSLR